VLRIGVDIGGSKIEIAALGEDGGERLRRRVPTPHGDYAAALAALAELARGAERELGQRASVGIGLPGAVSPRTGLVKNAYATPFNGQPLKRDLERLLDRELRFENDANCFALSEAIDGAARGQRLVFGAILGTGAGGGIVLEGRILGGANAIGGEWGHNPMPGEADGRPCYCGRKDCVETYLSGPAFERDGRDLARYHERLARALGVVINILDPEVIVLGGGVSKEKSLYTEVPKLWGRYIFSRTVATRLLPAVYGDASGVRGAAWLWDE